MVVRQQRSKYIPKNNRRNMQQKSSKNITKQHHTIAVSKLHQNFKRASIIVKSHLARTSIPRRAVTFWIKIGSLFRSKSTRILPFAMLPSMSSYILSILICYDNELWTYTTVNSNRVKQNFDELYHFFPSLLPSSSNMDVRINLIA